LALLELIQLVADLARVPWLRHQKKEYVMKNVVGDEQRDHDRHDPLKRQNNVQGCSCDRLNALKAMENSHVDARSEAAILALRSRFLKERLYGANMAQEFRLRVTSAVFDDRLVTSGLPR
jgi:hypothetical protein